MKAERRVIVNADDFGLTSGINKGIIEAHEHGLLTSASLMVRGSAANEAAEYARRNPALSVGLHFDAAEWRFDHGEWVKVYEVVDAADAAAVGGELQRQLTKLSELLGHGPTHLDSHQHIHLSEPARSILLRAAKDLCVPLRNFHPAITYCGDFYGQTGEGESYAEGISVEHLIRIIENLPPGWTELGTHPGYPDSLDSVYAAEREQELRVLCSAKVRTVFANEALQLCSFHDFGSGPPRLGEACL